jgi:dipeptidyl aminopeptidase/acylaminoacyl peptidase
MKTVFPTFARRLTAVRSSRAALLLAAASALLPATVEAQEPPTVNVFIAELREENGRVRVGTPVRITTAGGWNMQPAFSPDGRTLLYTSVRGRADARSQVFAYDLARGVERQVTRTAENENSPTIEPDGRTFVAVRWNPETLFTEYGPWRYSLEGEPLQPLLPHPDTVGYFHRLDENTFALMRPGETFSVALHDLRTGSTHVVAHPSAPLPPRPIPGTRAFSFTRTDDAGAHRIVRVEFPSGLTRDIGPTLPGRTSHVWTPRGTLLMARGNALHARRPGSGEEWLEVARFDAPELQQVTAYAVSPAGDRVVLLSPLRPPLATLLRDSIQAAGVDAGVESVRRMEQRGDLAAYDRQAAGLRAVAEEWVARGRSAQGVRILELVVDLLPGEAALRERLEELRHEEGSTG